MTMPASPSTDSRSVADTLVTLRQVFQDVLGAELPADAAGKAFTEFGLESLALMQASIEIKRRLGVDVAFRQMLEEFPTLERLAVHVAARRSDSAAPTTSAVEEKRVPLTDAQREIWFSSQRGGAASLAYNESMTLRLRGALDVGALHHAIRALAARHEALRARIAPDGQAQWISAKADVELPVHDFTGVTARVREQRVSAVLTDEIERAFDLTSGPLFRAAVLRLERDQHLLAIAVHHIVCDGWSLGILVRELSELYAAELAGRDARLAAAPSFSDYAERSADGADAAAFQAARSYWLAEFSGTPPLLELPTDRPRPSERTYAGGFKTHTLPTDVTATVKKLCTQHDCTAFTALLAAFNVLLHRLSGQDDVVVGVPSATQVMAGVGNLVGHFANLLPIRSRLKDGQTFVDYLADTRRSMNAALEHWRFPFGNLVQELHIPRENGRIPLAPVVFNTTGRRATFKFADLMADVEPTAKSFVAFDVNFTFALTDSGITLGCYYSAELFESATLSRWMQHFETLLRAVGEHPETPILDLPLLTPPERNQLLVEWNDTRMDYPRAARIQDLFADQVRRAPGNVAIIGGIERITYGELDERANAIAAQVRAAGAGPDKLVGLFLERSPNLVAAMLGILKAGAAYVPLDPAYPSDRLAFIIADTAMSAVVTDSKLAGYLPKGSVKRVLVEEALAQPSAEVPADAGATADNLAYVIYTSGSTGKPKGVCLTHRGVVALTAWARQWYQPEELAGVLFSTSVCFDVSVFESLVPLCLGGTIVIAENILHLSALPHADEVTLISSVPSAVAQVLKAGAIPSSVRTVNVAGEPCPQSLVDALYERPHITRVVDVYGPTETTVYSTGSVRVRGGRATIGRPLPNEQAYILDRRLQPVPVGVRGELYLGGDKLARGYLNRPELTRERFIVSPFDAGARLYRTGDAARYRSDGQIEYLGRLDDQVKVRGFRVELGEIEATMAECPGVAASAVAVKPGRGAAQLVGYVVAAPGQTISAHDVREHLRRRLADYMLPAAIVLLPGLPRTTSGKLDRRALPEPHFEADQAAMVAPRTTTEHLLAEIWRSVLGVKTIGVHDNFFELGGHSLLLAQVIARLHESLGVDLAMRDFFAAPTIAGIAPQLEKALLEQIETGGSSGVGDADEELALAKEQT